MELEKLYQQRFHDKAQVEKNKLWRELCRHFFARYVGREDTVVDVAAGFCEFINNIDCRRKIAVDINTDVRRYAAPDVEVVNAASTDLSAIPPNSVDVVFVSNFFEHISKEDMLTTIEQCHKLLRRG
ncbi:MAG: class I SAM-dependent methyltransferase, partial [Prevotellaceae bacterium]|nr:class I SAM-dependent methyltransferase [Prevotellaceae bacterium]